MDTTTNQLERPADSVRADSLAASVLIVVGMAGVQRLVGLVRNVLFCGMLDAEQLGRWSLTYSFLLLIAPFVVMGIPGSFGRYVEHYRLHGSLRGFLGRTLAVTCGLTLGAVALMWWQPRGLAWLLYDDTELWRLVTLVGATLLGVMAFNVIVELLTALRLVRVASAMQLVSSLAFAVVAIGLLFMSNLGEAAVIIAYGVASLLAAVVGGLVLLRVWKQLPVDSAAVSHGQLWSKLAPFAWWIWAGNLLGNLFETSDQFMLKHLSTLGPDATDALIGQYYCSRVVPLLMVGLAAMLASSFLPHLIKDWEAGRRDAVRRQVNTAVKLLGLSFTVGGAIVLIAAPLLFEQLLGGKYAIGLAVLPGTLVYCIWYCLTYLSQSYLLCAEKAKLCSVAMLGGLLLNVFLNAFLAPRFALEGVIVATATANAITLATTLLLSSRAGMRWEPGVIVVAALPLTLLLGGWAALVVATLLALLAFGRGYLFSDDELGRLTEATRQVGRRCTWKQLRTYGAR